MSVESTQPQLNGGAEDKFSRAISLFVNRRNQKKVDTLWNKLSAGGKKIACGWLTDKFGVTWQISPTILLDYLHDKNPTGDDDDAENRHQSPQAGVSKEITGAASLQQVVKMGNRESISVNTAIHLSGR